MKAPLKKLDPPSPDEQKRLIGQIDEVYKSGEAKDQAAKTALARKLLEDGRKNEGHRAEQFVMLRRAGEIACDAGEAGLDAGGRGCDCRRGVQYPAPSGQGAALEAACGARLLGRRSSDFDRQSRRA